MYLSFGTFNGFVKKMHDIHNNLPNFEEGHRYFPNIRFQFKMTLKESPVFTLQTPRKCLLANCLIRTQNKITNLLYYYSMTSNISILRLVIFLKWFCVNKKKVKMIQSTNFL